MALPKEVAEAVLGTALQPLLQQRMVGRNNAKKGQVAKPQIEYRDLEMHRIVGTGQFGMVRVVRHIPSNQAYALKVCYTASYTPWWMPLLSSCSNQRTDISLTWSEVWTISLTLCAMSPSTKPTLSRYSHAVMYVPQLTSLSPQ